MSAHRIERQARILYTCGMQMPFIGRDHDLKTCEESLARDDDRARVITVTGPPGMGKTAFAHRVIEIGEAQGWSVYTASLAEGRDDPPLHAWTQVLQSLRMDLATDADTTSLFSALYGAWEAVPEATGIDEANRMHLLFHLIGAYLARVAKDRRVLICLDNVHLCDASSLTLTKSLLETLPRHRLAFLLTLRPLEAAERSEILELLDTLQLYPTWEDVRLAELTEAEIRGAYDELRAGRPDTPDCDTLIDATRGNPLRLAAFLLGRSGLLGTESPLAGLWRRYRARLNGRAGRLLEALSILGNHVLPGEASVAAEVLGEGDPDQLIDDACYHGMLERDGDGYSFFHDDLRLLILDSLSPSACAALRDALIDRLRVTTSRDAESAAIRLAGLYLDAEESLEREEHLSGAAAILESRGAWKEAACYHEAVAAAALRRCDESARDRAEIRAFRCFAAGVDHEQVFRLLQPLVARLIDRDDVEGMRGLMDANPHIPGAIYRLARPIFERLIQVTPEDDPRWPQLLLWFNYHSPAGGEELSEQTREVESIADRILTSGSDQDRYFLHLVRAEFARIRKQLDEAICHLKRADAETGSRYRHNHLVEQAILCFFMESSKQWHEVVHRTEDASRATQFPVIREILEGILQRRYLYDGDFANVLAFGQDGPEPFLRGIPMVLAYYWTGDESAAQSYTGQIARQVRTDPLALSGVAWILSLDALLSGSDENFDLIVDGVRAERHRGKDGMIHRQHVFVSAGRICDRIWTDDECREMYDELAVFDDFYLDEEIHSVEIAKAMFADRLGRADDVLRHYEAAITWCEKVGEWPWRSWAWARLAEREIQGAREKALEIAKRIGNVYVLNMLGEGSAASAPDGPLSARETEVMDLAAKGYTDREIGSFLSISEHTVANHLRKIFRKLGASNRVEATRIAIEDRLIVTG